LYLISSTGSLDDIHFYTIYSFYFKLDWRPLFNSAKFGWYRHPIRDG